MTHRPSRKLAVILHADVVGSTRLVQQDESIAHQRIQEAFRSFSDLIRDYGGATHEIRGDALVAEFARASDAVSAATAFQIVNSESNQAIEDDIRPTLRIGISLGEVVIADNTVTGAGVVLAQRLEQLAEPGGVVVQGSVSETVPTRLPFEFSALGEQMLKGFDHPVRAFAANLRSGGTVPAPDSLSIATSTSEADGAATSPDMALPEKPSIVVLPFNNMSSDDEQEYFSDGISEDIITDLSRISGLFVIARNSAFTYKGKTFNVADVCQELGVRVALEGSVRKAGNRVRVTAQLIDGISGGHLWAERYDRDLVDIFEVQDDVTQNIVSALKVELKVAEQIRSAEGATQNMESHDCYLRGRELLYGMKRDREMFEQSTAYFQRAIDLDPDYAGPYAGMAMAYVLDYQNHWTERPESSLDRAWQFANEAIARDDDDFYAHYVAATVSVFRKDYDRWVLEADRALSLNPNYARAITVRGLLNIYTGDPLAAVPYIERSMRLDPAFAEQYLHFLGTAYFVARDYETAARLFDERISINPATDISRGFLAAALGHLDRAAEARQVWEELLEINPNYSLKEHVDRLPFKDPADAKIFVDGARKAGLSSQ